MTPAQLDVMWSHFRVLDSQRVHFEKPPATWKPPDVRDMNDDELNAYWNGFRQIMQSSSQLVQVDDSPDSACPAASASVSSSAPVKPPEVLAKRIRIRGKRPPAAAHELSLDQVAGGEVPVPVGEKGNGRGKGRGEGRGRGRPRKHPINEKAKAKAKAKVKVSRNGKNESLSIWRKEYDALCKDPTIRKASARICARLGLKASCVSKQTRHLTYDHPSMCAVRNYIAMLINKEQIEPRLMCYFDQVWTTHFEAAKRVLFKPREQAGVLNDIKLKPTKEQMIRSIRQALEISVEPDHEKKKGPKAPTLTAQSTLVPVEYQRNSRTTTTLSFADGTLGRAYITATQTVV
eukprot:s13_g2.t1